MFQSMRYVLEVYREMSFSRAAQNLYISQPSLSAAVKKVELEIGAPIFDRSTSPIRLTEIGAAYIRSAEAILQVETGFENYLQDQNGLKSGSLVIGGTNFFISYVLPSLLSRYSRHYPGIHIDLLEGPTSDLLDKLSAGSIDLLLDNTSYQSDHLAIRQLRKEHLLIAVPRRLIRDPEMEAYALTAEEIRRGCHTESDRPAIPLSHFKQADFLLLRRGNDTRSRAVRLCSLAGFEPRIRLELDQQITAYNLSCHGMGISFIGDSLIQNVPEDPGLAFFRLEGSDSVREINLYYKKNRYITRSLQSFLELADGDAAGL